MWKSIFSIFVFSGCSGSGVYQGVLANGMDNQTLSGIRIVAKSSPPSPDLTCQVRETTTDAQGAFTLSDLCHDQSYVMEIPQPNLQLSGNIVVQGSEQTEPGKHEAWWSPDGSGVYMLAGESVKPVPTFADVETGETIDGQKVRYPSMKPTGKVITIDAGKHLVISGKKTVKQMEFFPLVADPKRRRFKSGWITDHVFIGHRFESDARSAPVQADLDPAKVQEVLIRNEGVRYIAHDALPAGRYAMLGKNDNRVSILDFGESQAPAK